MAKSSGAASPLDDQPAGDDRAGSAEKDAASAAGKLDLTGGDKEVPAPALGFAYAAAKVREFPQTPGVYLMKDAAGVVIYVGKAVNLAPGAGSYFLKRPPTSIARQTWCARLPISTSSRPTARSTRC